MNIIGIIQSRRASMSNDVKVEQQDDEACSVSLQIPSSQQGDFKKTNKWAVAEDVVLKQLVNDFGEKNWRKISNIMIDRSAIQCLHRWSKILKPGLVKGPWTVEEDDKLMLWVAECGALKWSQCSKLIKGRSGKQCRERWFNNLNPNVKKGNWTQQEDNTIFKGYLTCGSSWSRIAKDLEGRTENSVKNRFYSTIRKLLSDMEKKGTFVHSDNESDIQNIIQQSLSMQDNSSHSIQNNPQQSSSLVSHLPSPLHNIFQKQPQSFTTSLSNSLPTPSLYNHCTQSLQTNDLSPSLIFNNENHTYFDSLSHNLFLSSPVSANNTPISLPRSPNEQPHDETQENQKEDQEEEMLFELPVMKCQVLSPSDEKLTKEKDDYPQQNSLYRLILEGNVSIKKTLSMRDYSLYQKNKAKTRNKKDQRDYSYSKQHKTTTQQPPSQQKISTLYQHYSTSSSLPSPTLKPVYTKKEKFPNISHETLNNLSTLFKEKMCKMQQSICTARTTVGSCISYKKERPNRSAKLSKILSTKTKEVQNKRTLPQGLKRTISSLENTLNEHNKHSALSQIQNTQSFHSKQHNQMQVIYDSQRTVMENITQNQQITNKLTCKTHSNPLHSDEDSGDNIDCEDNDDNEDSNKVQKQLMRYLISSFRKLMHSISQKYNKKIELDKKRQQQQYLNETRRRSQHLLKQNKHLNKAQLKKKDNSKTNEIRDNLTLCNYEQRPIKQVKKTAIPSNSSLLHLQENRIHIMSAQTHPESTQESNMNNNTLSFDKSIHRTVELHRENYATNFTPPLPPPYEQHPLLTVNTTISQLPLAVGKGDERIDYLINQLQSLENMLNTTKREVNKLEATINDTHIPLNQTELSNNHIANYSTLPFPSSRLSKMQQLQQHHYHPQHHQNDYYNDDDDDDDNDDLQQQQLNQQSLNLDIMQKDDEVGICESCPKRNEGEDIQGNVQSDNNRDVCEQKKENTMKSIQQEQQLLVDHNHYLHISSSQNLHFTQTKQSDLFTCQPYVKQLVMLNGDSNSYLNEDINSQIHLNVGFD